MKRVLGIETSCDETAAAVVSAEGAVFADVVASQIAEHAPYGGVVPELASRAHLRAIVPVVEEALAAVGGAERIEGIAVTQGPGLSGALLVGLQTAKALALRLGLPLVGVNHLDGHLLAPRLREPGGAAEGPAFPYVALLASGGHTALYRVDGPTQMALLGQTRDDAAGEAFDKAAKLLGLGYPGGPVVDRLAAAGDAKAIRFPRTTLGKGSLDFSFSGLKTAVARHLEREGRPEGEAGLADVCASFQAAVVDVLAKKLSDAALAEGVDTLVLTGGVAANRGLRARARELAASRGQTLHVPPVKRCTDNAAMIAYAGALRLAAGERDLDLVAFSRDPARRRGRFRPDGTPIPRRG
ncbi:MAG: tRNA (adenosine(37)-N6)-threonylcarbamoyltransferase complex transferase subunit TsaD [Myxococcota bacterium]